MKIDQQLSLADENPEYKAFIEKFERKKTTDDCYTPENVYRAVLDYCLERYDLRDAPIIRPFFPDMDYKQFDYPEGCVVIDNPPFSILSEIIRNFMKHEIRFFLFSPYLTAFSTARGMKGVTRIFTGETIMYANGASVPTAFQTNLEPEIFARTDLELKAAIKRANRENTKKDKPEIPKYVYPDYVATAADFGYLANHDTELTVYASDCVFIPGLDSQKPLKKAIFGSGILLSEKAAAEKAAAEKAAAEKAAAIKWTLSEQELNIIKELGK